MNISVPSYDAGSPTMYTVAVAVDRVNYSIKKRYNDFVELAKALEIEMGEPAPVELPGKKWIGRTNDAFLEERRQGLEQFLRAVCKRGEWRDSLAFGTFVERSKHTQSEASKAARARADWIKTVEGVEELLQRASHGGLPATERRRVLSLATSQLGQLEAVLAGDTALGPGERDRRKNSISALSQRIAQMRSSDTYSRSPTTGSSSEKPLSGGTNSIAPASSGRVLGARGPAQETDRTRELNNAGLLALQQEDMRDQDAQLETLRRAIARQRELGLAIQAEVDDQNGLLEELDADVHAVNSRLNQARRQTKKFT